MIRRFVRTSIWRHAGAASAALLLAGAVSAHAAPPQAGVPDDDVGELPATTSVPVVQSTAPSPTRLLNTALARLAKDPRDMNALLDAGGAALDLGDTDAAIGFLNRAEQIAPGNGGVRARIGIAMLRSNQPFEAIRWFDLADQAGFSRSEMATERGLAYDLIGDNAAAQRQYQLAIAAGPNDEASRRYALSLVIAGDRRGAELVIQPLLERQDRGAWRVRTFIMAIAGQSEEAEGIARATMPADLAAAISPYLRYMPRLTPAQQAAAANLGRFPRAADIGRDDPQVVQYALAHPRAPRVDAGLVPQGEALGARGRDTADSRAKRRRPGKDGKGDVALAAATPAPAPSPALVPPPPPPPPVPSAPARTPPAVAAPWGLQPGPRTAAAASPTPAASAPTKPVVLSKLDVPPGTPLAPRPAPTATAPVSAAVPVASAPTLPAPKPIPTPTPAPPPAPTPAPAATQLALAGPPSGAAGTMVPAPKVQAPPAPAPAPTAPPPTANPAPAAATPAPTDFRSAFDGFKAPEQEASSTTEAVDLARIEALRQSARVAASKAKERAAKDKEAADKAVKDRGERPDGPTAVSRTSGEELVDPSLTRAGKEKAAKAKAAKDKEARDKLALDPDCLTQSAKGKSAKGKAAATKAKSPARGRTTAKGKAASESQCPPDSGKKGKKGKAEPVNASRIWVQVLTGSNRAGLGKEWLRLQRQAAALKARKPFITPWRSNYRLLTGPFASDAEAQAFVDKLRGSNVPSFEWTSPAGQAVDSLSVK